MKQSIRIIAGKYKGKKIHFPAIEGLRPTPDRVKETVFNWLMHDIRGAKCLDLFAGSGSLGFEALSRGAKEVYFVEKSSLVANKIKSNLSDLHIDNAHVLISDGIKFLQQTTMSFDIIFLDPPFRNNLVSSCLIHLSHPIPLSKSGLVYIETECDSESDYSQWNLLRNKKAGQVSYLLMQKKSLTTIPTS
jgi:16S rRNA (guanine966-N2)-methyltransferase